MAGANLSSCLPQLPADADALVPMTYKKTIVQRRLCIYEPADIAQTKMHSLSAFQPARVKLKAACCFMAQAAVGSWTDLEAT